jgi:hypothetical protein
VNTPIVLQGEIKVLFCLSAGRVNKERLVFSVYAWRGRAKFEGVSCLSHMVAFSNFLLLIE